MFHFLKKNEYIPFIVTVSTSVVPSGMVVVSIIVVAAFFVVGVVVVIVVDVVVVVTLTLGERETEGDFNFHPGNIKLIALLQKILNGI